MARLKEMLQASIHAGNIPRVHGNGFLQLDLTDRVRLHLWGDYRIPRQKVYTGIHNHTFGFVSTILMGSLINRDIILNRSTGPATAAYYEAVAVRGDKENTILQPLRSVAVTAEVAFEKMYLPGESYKIRPYDFHETLAFTPTITVIQKDGPTLSQGGKPPTVLVPIGYQPDNGFDRHALPTFELWNLLMRHVSKVEDYDLGMFSAANCTST